MKLDRIKERLLEVQEELDRLSGTSNDRSTELGRKRHNRKSALYSQRKSLRQRLEEFLS